MFNFNIDEIDDYENHNIVIFKNGEMVSFEVSILDGNWIAMEKFSIDHFEAITDA